MWMASGVSPLSHVAPVRFQPVGVCSATLYVPGFNVELTVVCSPLCRLNGAPALVVNGNAVFVGSGDGIVTFLTINFEHVLIPVGIGAMKSLISAVNAFEDR